MITDSVIVRELEVFCRIGCTEAERAFPQRLLISLTIHTDTREVAKSLNLEHSIDFALAAELVRELGGSRDWVLVEELVEEIAQVILERFVAATTIQIKAQKFVLPATAWTGVEITRSRLK